MPTWDQIYAAGGGMPESPHPWVTSSVPYLRPGSRVLDLGCGQGRHSALLASQGMEVWSTDISPTGLGATRGRFDTTGAPRVLLSDMRALPFRDGAFAGVVAVHVLYHGLEADVARACAEAARVLEPAGYLIATFISTETWKYGLGRRLEEHTFVQPEGPESGVVHHYRDEAGLRALLAKFDVDALEFDDYRADDGLRHCHWHVRARKAPDYAESAGVPKRRPSLFTRKR